MHRAPTWAIQFMVVLTNRYICARICSRAMKLFDFLLNSAFYLLYSGRAGGVGIYSSL